MKCLLFLFTLCYVGRFFSQGQNEPVQSSSSSEEEENQKGGSSTEVSSEPDSSETELPQYEEITHNIVSEENKDKLPSRELDYVNDMESDEPKSRHLEEAKQLFALEMVAGNQADLISQNEHIQQASSYEDLGRRSVPEALKNTAAENDNYLIPEKAPPELVMLVAKESALLSSGKDMDLGSDIDQKKILRSGDYWNGVWKEEVKPKSAMRSGTEKKNLGSIKAKIQQGTELYKVVSQLKEISPKLLYIINKK